MKKRLFLFLAIILFVGAFTACSSDEIRERELRGWIEEHPSFLMRDGEFAQISEIEIMRRQTDREQGTDSIWLTVFATLGSIDFALSYYLHFGQYNNEWHLRELEPYSGIDGSWEQSFLNEEEILSMANETFLQLEVLDNLSIESLVLSYPVEASLCAWTDFLRLEFDLIAHDDIATFEMVLSLDFISTHQGWMHEAANVLSIRATPLQAIEQQIVDNIVDNLPYDQINFVLRDTDLENHFDVLIYTARNSFAGLDQLLDIEVIPFFNTQSGRWEVSYFNISETVIGEWLTDEYSDIPLAERGAPPVWLRNMTNIGANNFQISSNNRDNYDNYYVHALSLGTASLMGGGFNHPDDDHRLYRRGTFQTLLDGRYSRLQGTLFIAHGERESAYTEVWFEANGAIISEVFWMTNTTAPISIDIDLTDVNDFQIVVRRIAAPLLWGFDSPAIYFGDFRFYP